MTGRIALIAALVLSGIAAADAQQRPQRIVSTNLCTDQLLLRLVEPERIASLTYISARGDATAPQYKPILSRVKLNHGLAEEVLMLKPDLVVGSTYSARFTTDLLRRMGVTVVEFEPETSFETWYALVRQLGAAVGEPERAEKLVADFQSGLATLEAEIPPGEKPVYAALQVNNVMPGAGTLYAELVNAGGFRTAGEALGVTGYRAVPLEQLVRLKPALISTGSSYENPPSLSTRGLQHPLLRRMAAEAPLVIQTPPLDGSCTLPETLGLVRQLADARKQLEARAGR